MRMVSIHARGHMGAKEGGGTGASGVMSGLHLRAVIWNHDSTISPNPANHTTQARALLYCPLLSIIA